MSINFGREICGTLGQAEAREWLVTNGIGGYASGTVSWAIGSAAIGVIAGVLIGHGIDRSITKR